MISTLDDIAALLASQPSKPPIHLWSPPLSGDIDIHILADGRWLHEGDEIRRHELVKLFASILRREADEQYYLVTPVEKWRIQVDEQPLLIIDMEAANGQIVFRTNTDDWVALDAKHPLSMVMRQPRGEFYPVVQLPHGLSARVVQAVFYRLVELGQVQDGELQVESGGYPFSLGRIDGE